MRSTADLKAKMEVYGKQLQVWNLLLIRFNGRQCKRNIFPFVNERNFNGTAHVYYWHLVKCIQLIIVDSSNNNNQTCTRDNHSLLKYKQIFVSLYTSWPESLPNIFRFMEYTNCTLMYPKKHTKLAKTGSQGQLPFLIIKLGKHFYL